MDPEKLARAWLRSETAGRWGMMRPEVQAAYINMARQVIKELGIPPQGLIDENYWLYRALWEPTTGKPWTHYMRESPKTYLVFAVVGMARLFTIAGKSWWVVALAFLIGLLTGHVWW